MKLKLTFNNKVYHANMLDIPLVKQIMQMCPFELNIKGHKSMNIMLNFLKKQTLKEVNSNPKQKKIRYGFLLIGIAFAFFLMIVMFLLGKLFIWEILLKISVKI